MIHRISTLCFLTCCLLACGCNVGPNYKRPSTIADTSRRFINGSAGSTDANSIAIGQWWKNFNDPVLNDLVDSAIENNLELKSAAAAVKQYYGLLGVAKGSRLPDINISSSRTRGQTSIASGDTRINSIEQSYATDLTVSYVVDFFGRLKRTEQAAMNDLLSYEWDRIALVHSIIASVCQTRVNIATDRQILRITEENIESRLQTLKTVEMRYRKGLANSLNVHQARENLASVKSDLPFAKQQLTLEMHKLDVLLARQPGSSAVLAESLSDLPDIDPVPAGLPAELLDRRPDIIAAEKRLAAATERVGVSIAALYPDLTLTASGGFRSVSFEKMLNSEGLIYSAVAGLSAPIWRGGTLRAKSDSARALREKHISLYSAAVLNAMREVEDALVSQQLLFERINLLKARLGDAKRAEQAASKRYSSGLEKLLTILETQRRRLNAELEYANAKNMLWKARINLFLALGGDWSIAPLSDFALQENSKESKVN